jgi:hypothetical protein
MTSNDSVGVAAPPPWTNRTQVNGVWAVLNGVRFKATRVRPDGTVRLGYTGAGHPGHSAFSVDPATGAWNAVVPAPECDRIVEISHQAGYRRRQCHVAEIDSTGVVLNLVGGDDVTARELGFEMRERGVYSRFVTFADLDDYADVYKDVFFPYWQRLTFGFAPHAGDWQRYVPDPDLPPAGYDRFRLGRFAMVNDIEQPAEDFPAGASAFYEVSVAAHYRGEAYQVTTVRSNGMATLRGTGDGTWALGQGFTEVASGRFEKQAHIGMLYGYQEIRRDLVFDRWLAERAAV